MKPIETHTSLPLSKKIADAGFEGESEMRWFNTDLGAWALLPKSALHSDILNIPAYDILNDLLIRYAKEVWGEKGEIGYCPACSNFTALPSQGNKMFRTYEKHTYKILYLLQQGKKQEAEDYFWEHTILNPENKV